jgi:NAD(P)-dependent dehydrogenase (short-subunit alcohol dehydrogenase family)
MDEDGLPRGALSGKVAVVVGGASGIGRTAAKALARQGAKVVIADFDTERMERTVDELLHLGTAESALALTTDVRSDASVRSTAEDAIKAMGGVDILLNMAGVFLQGPTRKLKTGDWRWVLETNLLGVVRTTMAFVPHMVERHTGEIVNATSASATPLTIAYDSCAAAVAHFTRALGEELASSGVHVSLFAVGADGPRIGQNTRSRGMGRILHPAGDLEEPAIPDGVAVDALLEVLNR